MTAVISQQDRAVYRLITALNAAAALGTEEDLDAIIRDPIWQEDWRFIKPDPERSGKVREHGEKIRLLIRSKNQDEQGDSQQIGGEENTGATGAADHA